MEQNDVQCFTDTVEGRKSQLKSESKISQQSLVRERKAKNLN